MVWGLRFDGGCMMVVMGWGEGLMCRRVDVVIVMKD